MLLRLLQLLILNTDALSAPTLDDFLSFPTRQNLVAGTNNDACLNAVAWTELKSGVNNVWMIADAFHNQCVAEQVTNFTIDDGTEMFDLQLIANGDNCFPIFVLGPTAGANPNHNIQPPSYGTWVPEDLTKFPPTMIRRLNGVYQTVSPDGNQLLYVTKGDALSSTKVEVVQLASNSPPTPSFLFAVKQGTIHDLQWLKNDIILFSNNRGDHGFIGMYTIGTSRIKWLSASVDTDINPRLSPNGNMIAYLRLLGPQLSGNRGRGGHRGANFQVWVVEMSNFNSRMVYEDVSGFPDGGSGYGIRNMDWLSNSSILFGDESSGWCHPVVLDVTPSPSSSSSSFTVVPIDIFGKNSACEAKSWIVNHGVAWIVHNNCDGNLDTRSISTYKVGNKMSEIFVKGNITHGNGMAALGHGIVPYDIDNNYIAYFMTSPSEPTSVVFNNNQGTTCTVTKSWSLPTYTIPKTILIPSIDQKYTLHAQLFSVKGTYTSKGTVIFTHGGSQRQMFPYFHFGPCYAALYALNQYITTVLGYDVLSINYRSGIGYGYDFRVCDECMWLGGKEYIDVLAGANWLQKKYPINMKIGIHGLSYGGLNVLQAMSRNPSIFTVGVANAPVFNWISQSRYDHESFLDVEPQFQNGFNSLTVGPEPNLASPEWLKKIVPNAQELAYISSPVSHVQNLTGPLLLIQGDADDEVAFSESIGLMRAIRSFGRNNVISKVFPDETHGLARYETQLEAAMATAEFLDVHLQK
jgi:dipeptidyl aminopeptidase/acylaminoacyl peptidase